MPRRPRRGIVAFATNDMRPAGGSSLRRGRDGPGGRDHHGAAALGPFTGRQLTTIICIVAGFALFTVGAWAVSGSNAFITDATTGKHAAVDAAGAVRTFDLPFNWFSYPPQQASIASAGSTGVKPDPSGTRYAITSFTVNNPSASLATIRLTAFASNSAWTDCGVLFNVDDSAPGPEMTIAPSSTVELTFPTPFIIKRVIGTNVCLGAGGNGFAGLKWSAVGYRLPA
jgi:hypothetical protein